MKRKLATFFILFSIIFMVGCLHFWQQGFSMEDLQKLYSPESEQMFWIERYGVPDEIVIREEIAQVNGEEVKIKYETFFWRKGKKNEVWIQFQNDKAWIFSFM